jgi:hypothetical protein
MPGVDAFDKNALHYEEWFDEHPFACLSELHAMQELFPMHGIEIGIGTGRFALPFGIKQGIEPLRSMAEIAKGKGLFIVAGVAENQPYKNSHFDFCLMVTTVCILVTTCDRAFVIPATGRDSDRDGR